MRQMCFRFFTLFVYFFIGINVSTNAQCIVVSNSSYYAEDFENSNGNWTPGGTNTDWAWGIPSKATINAGGAGQRCWITGGLAKNTYNTGQRSSLNSPCFDFTNLSNPIIYFNVFWETETTYDGGGLQYSIDNGTTWINIGSSGESPSCNNKNWFNSSSIINLTQQSNRSGWSGTLKPAGGGCGGGNGSGGWLRASHEIQNLAGKANVKFRFTFGAGTTCNTYDGFAVDEIFIRDISPPFNANVTNKTSVSCFGGNDGSATVIGNGAGPYLFNWAPSGGTGSTANNLSAGTYLATVTDGNGCKDTESVEIVQPIPLIVKAMATSTTCGVSNGLVNANVVSGGVGPFTYLWTPGNYPVSSIGNLPPDIYTVVVTDSKGCKATAFDTVKPSSPPFIVAMNHTDAKCNGQANGTATATVINGTAPFNFIWSDGTNSYSGNPLTGIRAGNYTLRIIDAFGCADFNIVTVGEPSPLVHSVVANPISCTSPTGLATIAQSGGTAPYTYLWSPVGGSASTASGLTVGNYVATITDAQGCMDTAQVNIINTSTVIPSISNVVNVSCNNGNNGSATVTSSGVAPFSYAWSPSGGVGAIGTSLSAGNYTVIVTDATGCKGSAAAVINQPSPFVSVVSPVGTTCGFNNGSASVVVSGSNGGYVYLWTPGNFATSAINNLSAGPYNLTITDAKGCATNVNAVVASSSSPTVSTIVTKNVTCNGLQTGSANAILAGGTAPYTFQWTSGSNTFGGNPLQNAGAGLYQLTITDALGCTGAGSTNITEPPPIQHVVMITPATCERPNGRAIALISGGVLPYSYNWSPSGGNTFIASNLSPGWYFLTIKDSNNCLDTAQVQIPDAGKMTINITKVGNVKCFGGSDGFASASVVGGVLPLSYSWAPSGGNDSIANNLKTGTYYLTVTDQSGCTSNETVKIFSPKLLKISLGNDTAVCPGTKMVLSPGNFHSYKWQDNSSDTFFNVVQSGNYAVEVTDTNGCKASAAVKVVFECQDVLFPNAFTPDGNGKNDLFGPLGTLSAVKDYSLRIYSRWGQLVFFTINPWQKWDVKVNGKDPGNSTFVWIAAYKFNSQPRTEKKGTVVIIR